MIAVYEERVKHGRKFIVEIDKITLTLNLKRLKVLHKAISHILIEDTINKKHKY